jgi:DNA invertase Pin-like site-specific DNA recombinase
MPIGYARVSTHEQNLNLQLDALRKEGVEEPHIFTDKVTGTKRLRGQA